MTQIPTLDNQIHGDTINGRDHFRKPVPGAGGSSKYGFMRNTWVYAKILWGGQGKRYILVGHLEEILDGNKHAPHLGLNKDLS